MDLRDAVKLVWDDVADGVYRHPTVLDAVNYARNEMTSDELALALENQREGVYEELGDVYGAYVDVRDATQEEINNVIATFDVDLH